MTIDKMGKKGEPAGLALWEQETQGPHLVGYETERELWYCLKFGEYQFGFEEGFAYAIDVEPPEPDDDLIERAERAIEALGNPDLPLWIVGNTESAYGTRTVWRYRFDREQGDWVLTHRSEAPVQAYPL